MPSLSNLPPGVSERDYQVGGADREEEATFWCDACDAEVDGTREFHQGQARCFHDVEEDRGVGTVMVAHYTEWESTEGGGYSEDELYEQWKDDQRDVKDMADRRAMSGSGDTPPDLNDERDAGFDKLGMSVDAAYEDRFETASDGGELW